MSASSTNMKENQSMQTEFHHGVAKGDKKTVHTQQCSQLQRTSSTPGGNENILLPDTTQTSTSPQCDQYQTNIFIASKVTETRPRDSTEFDSVSLSLGRYPGNSSGEEADKNAFNNKDHIMLHKKLASGLEFRADTFSSELKSNLNCGGRIEAGEDTEKEENNRSLKTPKSEDDYNSFQNPSKKAKVVTVRMPCNTPVTGDGCQWKKYGQKAAKGSPFPRSYYHCCVTPICEAKKQVQICPNDLSTLITTYEGVHNHPLPEISTNVASEPTAAVPMSRCPSTGSLTSQTTHRITPGTRRSLISQQSGFPASSLPPTGKPPALSIMLPKTQLLLNPATIYSPTRHHIFPVGSSFAQTNRPSLTSKGHAGTSHLGRLTSPRCQHKMENSVPGKQPMKRLSSQPPTSNRLISAQQTMNDKIAAATTMITSSPAFQSQVAAVVSSLISNNSNMGLPEAPIPLLYMPSGLGPSNRSSASLNSQLGNSLSTTFPYHAPEAPLFPTSQNGDHKK